MPCSAGNCPIVEKSARYSENRQLTCQVLQVIQLTVDLPYMAGLSTGKSMDKPASLGRSTVPFLTCHIWQEFQSENFLNRTILDINYHDILVLMIYVNFKHHTSSPLFYKSLKFSIRHGLQNLDLIFRNTVVSF